MPIKAVIFDLDGTLTKPWFKFDVIRAEIGLSQEAGPILEAMEKMTPEDKLRAEEILRRYEHLAITESTLNPGAKETLLALREMDIPIGVLTRNEKVNAATVLDMHGLIVDVVVGREDGPAKPDAFGVHEICRRFGVDPSQTLVVGDFLFDLLAAKAAGARAVLITTHEKADDFASHAEFTIENIEQILQIIKNENSIA